MDNEKRESLRNIQKVRELVFEVIQAANQDGFVLVTLRQGHVSGLICHTLSSDGKLSECIQSRLQGLVLEDLSDVVTLKQDHIEG